MHMSKTQLEAAVEFLAQNNFRLRERYTKNEFLTELPIPTVDEGGLRDYIRHRILECTKRLLVESAKDPEFQCIGSAGFTVQFADENLLEVLVDPAVAQNKEFVNLTEIGLDSAFLRSI